MGSSDALAAGPSRPQPGQPKNTRVETRSLAFLPLYAKCRIRVSSRCRAAEASVQPATFRGWGAEPRGNTQTGIHGRQCFPHTEVQSAMTRRCLKAVKWGRGKRRRSRRVCKPGRLLDPLDYCVRSMMALPGIISRLISPPAQSLIELDGPRNPPKSNTVDWSRSYLHVGN